MKLAASAYFPLFVDFRSRFYYRPTFSPQGDTYAKGLSHFSSVETVTDQGRWEILRTLGQLNTSGEVDYSKLDHKDQVDWAERNLASHPGRRRPLGTVDFWSHTDSPFEFLATCRALRASQNGEATGSHPHRRGLLWRPTPGHAGDEIAKRQSPRGASP